MTAQDYGVIQGGVCTNMIWLDPDETDPVTFAPLIGADVLLPRVNYADGQWGIGAIWDGETITMPPPPAPPQIDPNAPPPAPPEPTQNDRIEAKLDELLGLMRELAGTGEQPPADGGDTSEPGGTDGTASARS